VQPRAQRPAFAATRLVTWRVEVMRRTAALREPVANRRCVHPRHDVEVVLPKRRRDAGAVRLETVATLGCTPSGLGTSPNALSSPWPAHRAARDWAPRNRCARARPADAGLPCERTVSATPSTAPESARARTRTAPSGAHGTGAAPTPQQTNARAGTIDLATSGAAGPRSCEASLRCPGASGRTYVRSREDSGADGRLSTTVPANQSCNVCRLRVKGWLAKPKP